MSWFLVWIFVSGSGQPGSMEVIASMGDDKKMCFMAAKIFQEETPQANGDKPLGRFACMEFHAARLRPRE